ncbi:hypothetical protein [Acinetobacter sp. SA01]|uniref:hypothetical protein n=1 Tax=Acinetobacter sp. SA01 TaxID=1862567 RepID=UPI00140D443D|nr:hypothetical protein [Acinetobacter sp. SA01]
MQYPKMLYKGSQAKYTYEIAQHEAHEDELREQGWIGFYDLPEQGENQYTGEAHSIDSAALVPVEQFDALALKVAELEQENAELSKKLRIKELEDTSADDLKVLLTERNVPFGARDSKAVLLNLVIESDGSE